jgi:rifampicin phosphotransferase
MNLCLDLCDLEVELAEKSGGKAFALSQLLQKGFVVPYGFCILTEAYRTFVDGTPLAERIRMELGRKDFRHMRWEELWDAALRIRNLFARTKYPAELENVLRKQIESRIGSQPAAIRSSAIGEDSGQLSFAGLHESVLNIVGTDNILKQIKSVWASLWSDAALLYRQELGLEVEHSAMAVLVQRFVAGDCSGVIFTQSPLDPRIAVIEAVSGLAKGLVDGAVEPERWEIDRDSGKVLSRKAPLEQRRTVAVAGGTRIVEEDRAEGSDLLKPRQAAELYKTAREAERLFGTAQDMEWTYSAQGLQILQSRPVTAKTQDPDEKRVWNQIGRASCRERV